MGIRREEEMEMSDDDMEDASESKDSDDSGTHNPLTHRPMPSRSRPWRSPGRHSSAHFNSFSACSLKRCLIKCEKFGVEKLFFLCVCVLLSLACQRITRFSHTVSANKTLQCVMRIIIGNHSVCRALALTFIV